MRRLALVLLVVLPAAACTRALPESDDWSPAVIDADVVLWRLVDGPAGFLGVGGPVTPEDLEDASRPLSMAAYRSGDGITWEETFTFGATTGPLFSLAGSGERYAVAGDWIDGPAVFLSADGTDWQRVELPRPPGGAFELEAAGIADDGDTAIVFGSTQDPITPVAWAIADSGTATLADTSSFGTNSRLTAAAVGPGGFVAALQTDPDTGTVLPDIWRSEDGAVWESVADLFPADTRVDGLIGGSSGYVALVAQEDDQEDFTVWTSADGMDWRERATDDTVFDLLAGTSGMLYPALAAPTTGESEGTRPVAFSFGGYWLEIPAAYDGERFLSVAVTVDERRRVVSGISGSGSDLQPHVLVADP